MFLEVVVDLVCQEKFVVRDTATQKVLQGDVSILVAWPSHRL